MKNREIKFRGMRVEYNSTYHESVWKHGNLLSNDSIGDVGAHLDSYEYAEVLPATIGQFTGIEDKNEKEIYEGDILNKKTTFENNMADKRFQPATQINVGFDNGCFIDLNTGVVLFEKMITVTSFPEKYWTNYEVLGNIYENPELQ